MICNDCQIMNDVIKFPDPTKDREFVFKGKVCFSNHTILRHLNAMLAQGSFERTDLQNFNYPWTALEGGRKKMKLELIDA